MLQVIRLLVSHNIKTKGDVLFIGTVGEEAEGDLRGVKRIFYSSGIHLDGVVAIDSANPGKFFMAQQVRSVTRLSIWARAATAF